MITVVIMSLLVRESESLGKFLKTDPLLFLRKGKKIVEESRDIGKKINEYRTKGSKQDPQKSAKEQQCLQESPGSKFSNYEKCAHSVVRDWRGNVVPDGRGNRSCYDNGCTYTCGACFKSPTHISEAEEAEDSRE